jgi:hypothetical protein
VIHGLCEFYAGFALRGVPPWRKYPPGFLYAVLKRGQYLLWILFNLDTHNTLHQALKGVTSVVSDSPVSIREPRILQFPQTTALCFVPYAKALYQQLVCGRLVLVQQNVVCVLTGRTGIGRDSEVGVGWVHSRGHLLFGPVLMNHIIEGDVGSQTELLVYGFPVRLLAGLRAVVRYLAAAAVFEWVFWLLELVAVRAS